MAAGSTMLLSLLIRVREEGVGLLAKARAELQQLAAVSHIGDAAALSGRALYGTALVAKGLGQALAEANRKGRELGETMIHGSLGAAAAIYTFKKSFLDIAVDAEQARAKLQGIEGTPGRAESAMAWTEAFREKTASTLAEVRQAWVEFRQHAINPLNGSMQAVADAAAAIGKPLSQVARQYSEIVAGGHGEGHFRELGLEIAPVAKNANMIRLTYHNLGQTITQDIPKANRPLLEMALNTALIAKYGGAAERASQGWSGTLLKMSENWSSFALAVMEKGGVFEVLKNRFAEFVEGGKKDAQGLNENARSLAEGLKSLINIAFDLLTGLRANLPWVIEKAKAFTEAVGGWKVVLGVALAILAGPFLAALVPIGTAIGVLAAAIATVLLPALAYLAGAFVALGALILTTPIGWILMGIVALGAGIWWLYSNWDKAIKWLGELWVWLKDKLNIDFGIERLKEGADNLMAAWAKIGPFFSELWAGVKRDFDAVIGWIKRQVDEVKSWLPSWAGGTVPTTAGPGATGAAIGGIVGGGGMVSGLIRVQLEAKDGTSARVVGSSMSGPLDLSTGLTMVGP
jgi:hypothetical protein